jgi:hypothetical protein
MTPQESKSIGGKQLLKGATFLFLICELIMLIIETRGYFANGILFFISAQTNPIFFFLKVLYFAIMFLFGRKAGFGILIRKRKYNLVGLLYGVIVTIISISFLALFIILLRNLDINLTYKQVAVISVRNFFILLIPMSLTWLWAAKKINRRKEHE